MILSASTVNFHLRQPAKISSNAWSVNLEASLWTRQKELQMYHGDCVCRAISQPCACTDLNTDNLRYAFSACVFGNPVKKTAISTPCQVSCDPLKNALGHNLDTNATIEDLSYCNIPGFQDTIGINRCAACYGRMDGQVYMANCMAYCWELTQPQVQHG